MDYVNGIPALAGSDALNDVPHYTDELRAVLLGMVGMGRWQDYAPDFGSLDIGNGVVTGRMARIGDTVKLRGSLVFGSTTVITGSGFRVNLPVPASLAAGDALGQPMGDVYVVDSSVGTSSRTLGKLLLANGASETFVVLNGPGADAGSINANTPWTWAEGDELRWFVDYEAA